MGHARRPFPRVSVSTDGFLTGARGSGGEAPSFRALGGLGTDQSLSRLDGGGRYLLDTVKGADLGTQGGRLIIDLNFLYHPSCRYDSRWVCPLAPHDNVIDVPIQAGERLTWPG